MWYEAKSFLLQVISLQWILLTLSGIETQSHHYRELLHTYMMAFDSLNVYDHRWQIWSIFYFLREVIFSFWSIKWFCNAYCSCGKTFFVEDLACFVKPFSACSGGFSCDEWYRSRFYRFSNTFCILIYFQRSINYNLWKVY